MIVQLTYRTARIYLLLCSVAYAGPNTTTTTTKAPDNKQPSPMNIWAPNIHHTDGLKIMRNLDKVGDDLYEQTKARKARGE
jgi:hypothetical protein